MKILRFRRLAIGLLAALVLYIGSYCILSALGGYCFDQSGRVRWNFGVTASDLSVWHPKYGWFRSDYLDYDGKIGTRGDALGYFYSPLIWLDRKLVHKTAILPGFEKFHEE